MGTGDPYVYDGTDVLRNLFGERDQDRLSALEQEQSLEAIAGLRTDPVSGRFDSAHLREIHRRIFAGVYPFAGRERTISLSKDEIVLGGRSVRYAEPDEIAGRLDAATAGLATFRFDATRPKGSLAELARHHAAVWQVHPFREGNTRAVLTFALQHGRERGFEFDAPALARHPSETRDALTLAAAGDGQGLSAILHRAWSSQRERTHARIGRLTSEASEIMRLLGHPPLTVPKPGDAARGTILTVSYDAVLLRNADGVQAVHKSNFKGLGLRVNDRANIIVSQELETGLDQIAPNTTSRKKTFGIED